MPSHFFLSVLTFSAPLADNLRQQLSSDPHETSYHKNLVDLLKWVKLNRQKVDCLIVEADADDQLMTLVKQLRSQDIWLPLLVLTPAPVDPQAPSSFGYHRAVTFLSTTQLDQLDLAINQAIADFLKLPGATASPVPTFSAERSDTNANQHLLLSLQQKRLAERLRERLGYLGVYYKRHPQNFLRNMTQAERRELIDRLRRDYREIILNYFSDSGVSELNQKIDDYINVAFFADISVSQVVEIHMELMENFSKQLQLEGRSEDILLDYRLTLIDVIAHLCEMYRRSIPRDP